MAAFCRYQAKTTPNEREFCRALLNNENPIWVSISLSLVLFFNSSISKNDNNIAKLRKRGCRLPPDDFVYGLKHPKQNGITGVAAGKYPIGFLCSFTLTFPLALQHKHTPVDIPKLQTIPNFIAINKIAARLGLTKVQDIHQYR